MHPSLCVNLSCCCCCCCSDPRWQCSITHNRLNECTVRLYIEYRIDVVLFHLLLLLVNNNNGEFVRESVADQHPSRGCWSYCCTEQWWRPANHRTLCIVVSAFGQHSNSSSRSERYNTSIKRLIERQLPSAQHIASSTYIILSFCLFPFRDGAWCASFYVYKSVGLVCISLPSIARKAAGWMNASLKGFAAISIASCLFLFFFFKW